MRLTPKTIYKKLSKELGKQNWWPMDNEYHKNNHTDPRFEVIVGAILTQNTAWSNVEKAIDTLKKYRILDIDNISNKNLNKIKVMIKSAGFFNQKAERLKNFAVYLKDNYNGSLDLFFSRGIIDIRNELLSLNGVGPETADSILLYAGNKPIFVVDAYTKRLCQRLPLNTDVDYENIQNYFQNELSKSYSKDELLGTYNELHALIVIFAKTYCKKKPLCKDCPLEKNCKYPGKNLS